VARIFIAKGSCHTHLATAPRLFAWRESGGIDTIGIAATTASNLSRIRKGLGNSLFLKSFISVGNSTATPGVRPIANGAILRAKGRKLPKESQVMNQLCTDEQRWDAVRLRQPLADGVFYYAVRTTGVYCRPSCAARLPRRENVRFFALPSAAESAGFRACKRCRPNATAPGEVQAALVAQACRSIEQAEQAPKLATLAAQAGLSRFYFQRLFKRLVGLTPNAYAAALRAQRVRERLPDSGSVTAALYDAGFNSNARFYAQSGAALGMMPSVYRTGGAGEQISFAIGQCTLGAILVAATARGVCAITLGDQPDALLADLQDRFPRSQLRGGDAAFERLVATVIGFVEAPGLGLDLPLDLQGSSFQLRVWQALRAVPAGQTVSYAELARRLGVPNATRAVGRAVGANPLAVAIPCHRVIRSDGALSGYRWGVERKRTLLAREGRSI
jgi:AraC family transcriptional regulator, regulatory protein of adaptative response / methylated-DNA-[protein]-cysteine methyltransferase